MNPKPGRLVLAALLLLGSIFSFESAFAQGEASTYFNVFVPPNADPVKRNVCLVVTAVFDGTEFEIVDDGMDGDTDDSKTGTLSAGQSYVLYIADNGINDDAKYASGGVLKQDGDYFFIRTNKNVLVSQSTNSDWQHDFVPSVSQKGIGEKFVVYAPQVSSSKRDLNVFAFSDSTLVSIKRITTLPTTVTGLTNIDYANAVTVGTQLLNRGQDLIYSSTLGRDVMETGHTYLVEASKPVSLQYGALFGNERDGGGNVPSSNGSSTGELFYFAVPYQSGGEQEIRIVSWDESNSVKLERYSAGTWVTVKNWTMAKYGFGDWVGKSNGNASYATVFRVTCSSGKRVSVFEANWLETGNPGTSDIGTMMTSENGTTAGKKFIAYIAPPGNEYNVRDPFTGTLFNQQLSHLYISSRSGARVTVKDAYTNGVDFNRTFDIQPERYADCAITLDQWKKMYNGTGTVAGGPERPYVIIESDKPVSVFNTNFNDNWMAYLGTSQPQAMSLGTVVPSSAIIPGDTSIVITNVTTKLDEPVSSTTAVVEVEGNVRIVSSVFADGSNNTISATISPDAQKATFSQLPELQPSSSYSITTEVVTTVDNSKGQLNLGNSVGTITTAITGEVGGNPIQSVSTEGVFVNSSNQSQLMFTHSSAATWNTETDSWAVNMIDYNNDGWDDLFVSERATTAGNYLYRNNGDKTFTPVTTGAIVKDLGPSISASWADIDNDGDLDALVANNTNTANFFYLNNGDGTFTRNNNAGFTKQAGYYQSATWVDYDNDGWVDLFLCNYWPTRLNELWRNNGKGTFTLQENSLLSQITGDATSAAWADYDNDGLMDVFLPNNKGGKNLLIHNDGNGKFSAVTSPVSKDGGYSVAACWGDVDGNGYADLFVSNASNRNNYLYLNTGSDFKKVTAGSVVNDGGHSHGCSFADVDNDADLDLYVTNDQGEKFLYLNDGAGNFTRKYNETMTVDYGKSMGHAWSDLDKDGDLDLFTATHSKQKNHLFWNNGSSNNWIQLKLTGTASNRCAVGAQVRVKADGKWQRRDVVSQSGIGGQSSYRVHFGLGAATRIDSIEVQWPSGGRQAITNTGANQFLNIVEQPSGRVVLTLFSDSDGDCVRAEGEMGVAGIKVRIEPINVIAVTGRDGSIAADLAPGKYVFHVLASEKYTAGCRSSVDVSVVKTGITLELDAIGLKPVCDCADAQVKLYTTALRRGFGNDYFVEVSNTGSTALKNATLKLTKPQALAVSAGKPAWDDTKEDGDKNDFHWKLGTLEAGSSITISVRDSVSLKYQVNDVIRVEATVAGDGETDLSNNKAVDENVVVGAIDPNMLVAMPLGTGAERYVDATKPITYKTYFENIGTYKSSFVTVTDTLASQLDAATIRNITSSHGAVRTTVRGQIVTLWIEAELLPVEEDSAAAQGFVQFDVMPALGASGAVTNRVAIVFDYNEPLMTNEVTLTLATRESMEAGSLAVFPNPATGSEEVSLMIRPTDEGSASIGAVTITTINGVVLSKLTSASRETLASISTGELLPGIYVVEASAADGRVYRTKLVVR